MFQIKGLTAPSMNALFACLLVIKIYVASLSIDVHGLIYVGYEASCKDP